MGRGSDAPGAAGLLLVDGVSLLRPDEQVFAAMLDGWRAQQLARNLAFDTIDKRLNTGARSPDMQMRSRGYGGRR